MRLCMASARILKMHTHESPSETALRSHGLESGFQGGSRSKTPFLSHFKTRFKSLILKPLCVSHGLKSGFQNQERAESRFENVFPNMILVHVNTPNVLTVAIFRPLGRLFDVGFLQPHHMARLCGRPSLPHNFKGNKLHQICCFTKLSRPIIFNFDKVAKQWNSPKFRITWLNIGKIWPMAAFSQRARSVGLPRQTCYQGALQ